MDIRDVKEKVPSVENGLYLEKIYELQKVLIDHYIKIENSESYPLDINLKKSQILVKDFVGRTIEELGEAYESYEEVDYITEKNLYWTDEDLEDSNETNEYKSMVNALQNFNEELADALHFMIELLIYSNVYPEDIDKWICKQARLLGIAIPESSDILYKSLLIGKYLFSDIYPTKSIDLDSHINLDLISKNKLLTKYSYIKGGIKFNNRSLTDHGNMLWLITYNLNMLRNTLKNKPWKQSSMLTDENKYQSKLVESFISLMGFYYYVGLCNTDIFYLYYKKNCINQFRIKSNY